MNASKLIILSLAFLTLTNCASLNTRNKILRDMAIGAVVGGLIGQSEKNNKTAYTTMYAGVGAATAGVISSLINIPDENQIQKENNFLKEQVKDYEKQFKPQLVQNGKSLFTSPIPKEVSSLIEPGEWKRYKLDQWVQDPSQSNVWYRQVEMFEVIPPVTK